MTFDRAHKALARALADHGYATPTPVQAAVLEERAEGRDLLVSAQTGSGKTVAFGIAMAENLLDDGTLLPQSACRSPPPASAPAIAGCGYDRGEAGAQMWSQCPDFQTGGGPAAECSALSPGA